MIKEEKDEKSLADKLRKISGDLPQEVRDVGSLVASMLPGYATREGMRSSREAARLWRDGRHGRALTHMGYAIDKTLDDVYFFIPGMGIIRGPK